MAPLKTIVRGALVVLAMSAAVATASPVAADPRDSFIDKVPLLSHLKTGWQWLFGDAEGARRTASRYAEDGVGSAQLESLLLLWKGEPAQAFQVQKRNFGKLMNLAKELPVVGPAVSDAARWAANGGGKLIAAVSDVVAGVRSGVMSNLQQMVMGRPEKDPMLVKTAKPSN